MGQFGPENGSLKVKTYREGVAARAGHDLVIEVATWQAKLDGEHVELTADPHSLQIREGQHGMKPLTDHDRGEIRKNIDHKVLHGQAIAFAGTVTDDGGHLVADGQLTMAGTTRPLRVQLAKADGRAAATVTLRQSDWGIKPYRGLMGALRVRDELEVLIDVPVPAA